MVAKGHPGGKGWKDPPQESICHTVLLSLNPGITSTSQLTSKSLVYSFYSPFFPLQMTWDLPKRSALELQSSRCWAYHCIYILPTPTHGNSLLVIIVMQWLIMVVEGDHEFLKILVYLLHTLRGPTSEINECLTSVSFQNWNLQKEVHSSPNFLRETWFKCPQVTDGLIICTNVLLTLWGQLCFP